MAASYEYSLGPSVGGLVNIETMIGVAPYTNAFRPWSVQRTSADGTVRSDGYVNFEWTFSYVTRAMLFALLVGSGLVAGVLYWNYEPAISVYVRTRDPFGSYYNFLAQMILPDGWEFEVRGYTNLVIRFTNAVAA